MEMTQLNQKQRNELKKLLTEDILMRYDNNQYWDAQIIEDYLLEKQAELIQTKT